MFLKGPIPWDWLATAMTLPGTALHVAIRLWFLGGMKDDPKVTLSLSGMEHLGVARETARRGLRSLESAGLVSVERVLCC